MKPSIGQISLGALLGAIGATVLDLIIVLAGTVVVGAVDILRRETYGQAFSIDWSSFGGIWSISLVVGTFSGMIIFALLRKFDIQKTAAILSTIAQFALVGLAIGTAISFVLGLAQGSDDGMAFIIAAGTMLGAWIGGYYTVRES